MSGSVHGRSKFPDLFFFLHVTCLMKSQNTKDRKKDGGQVPASIGPHEKSVDGICHVQKRSFFGFQKQPFNTKHRK